MAVSEHRSHSQAHQIELNKYAWRMSNTSFQADHMIDDETRMHYLTF